MSAGSQSPNSIAIRLRLTNMTSVKPPRLQASLRDTVRRSQIDNDDAIGPCRRRIGDECHALSATMQIEANVIQVCRRQSNLRRKDDFPDDLIRAQIDRN